MSSSSPITPFSSPSPSPGDVHHITRNVIRRLQGLAHSDEQEEGGMLDVEDDTTTTTTPVHDDDTDDLLSSLNVSDGEVERTLVGEWENDLDDDDDELTNGVVPKPPVTRPKIDWEIPRKVLHSSIGFFTLYLYITESSVSKVVFVLWSSLCIIIPADLLRFRSPRFERVYERFLGFLMRDSEKNSTNGVIWYILGVNFALQFYPRDVATIAILILSWADTAASTIGRLYGPTSPRLPSSLPLPHRSLPLIHIPLAPRKSVAGFGAACAMGAVVAVGFWWCVGPMASREELSWDFVKGVRGSGGVLSGWAGLGLMGVFVGLVSGVAEAMDLGKMDDNLTLPIISGGCILGFLKAVAWMGRWWTLLSSSSSSSA